MMRFRVEGDDRQTGKRRTLLVDAADAEGAAWAARIRGVDAASAVEDHTRPFLWWERIRPVLYSRRLIAPLLILFSAVAVLTPVIYPVWTQRWVERTTIRSPYERPTERSSDKYWQDRSWLLSGPPKRVVGIVWDDVTFDRYDARIEYGRVLVECGAIAFVLGAVVAAGWVYGTSQRRDAAKA